MPSSRTGNPIHESLSFTGDTKSTRRYQTTRRCQTTRYQINKKFTDPFIRSSLYTLDTFLSLMLYDLLACAWWNSPANYCLRPGSSVSVPVACIEPSSSQEAWNFSSLLIYPQPVVWLSYSQCSLGGSQSIWDSDKADKQTTISVSLSWTHGLWNLLACP